MKTRRNHNNRGTRQIARGRTVKQVQRLAAKLGLRYSR